MPAMPGMPGMPAPNHDGNSETVPPQPLDCPLAVVGNGSSCLAFAVTAAALRNQAGLEHAFQNPQSDPKIMPSDLLGSGLFHPPKA